MLGVPCWAHKKTDTHTHTHRHTQRCQRLGSEVSGVLVTDERTMAGESLQHSLSPFPLERSSACMTQSSRRWRGGPRAFFIFRRELLTGLTCSGGRERTLLDPDSVSWTRGIRVRCRCHVLRVWVMDQDYIIPPGCRSWYIDSDVVTCRPGNATESPHRSPFGAGVALDSY